MFERGDIAIVPFPYSDLSAVKRRPVLVLSSNRHNKASEDLLICAITSNLKESPYSVIFDQECLVSGKVPRKSRIRTDKIFTISKSKIIKKVAMISPECLLKVNKELKRVFGLSD